MKCIFLVTIFLIGAFAQNGPVISTKDGQIRGTYRTSVQGRQFASFEKIPFASPPVGDLRFQPPQPNIPWTGILNANDNTSICNQLVQNPQNDVIVTGTEDCLYLNVYSPNLTPNKSLDVIVYIHGGFFMMGSGNNVGPENILDYNVVFVTFNYRLGPLGFLSLQDNELPGNNGLKDQVQALKWVNENIASFGGNPKSITLAGVDAGGASVHYHYLSPLSRGLFQRGISISGTALNNWALVEHPKEKAERFVDILGCDLQSSKAVLNCLRQKPVYNITATASKFQAWLYNPFTPFGPVVEPNGKPGTRFIDDYPYFLLRAGKVVDLPWITSVVTQEGLYPGADFLTQERLNYLNENWSFISAYIMHYQDTIAQNMQQIVAAETAQEYWNSSAISFATFPQLVQALGDRLFVTDAQKSARVQANVTKSSVYFYRFDYRGQNTLSTYFTNNTENLGVAHGDDMQYIMSQILPVFKGLTAAEDLQMSNRMTQMWTSFANTGLPSFGNSTWNPISKNQDSQLDYLEINAPNNASMTVVDYLGHYTFWNAFQFCENEKVNETCVKNRYVYFKDANKIVLRY